MSSKQNLKNVKIGLETFILEHPEIPFVNFLHLNIKRMEYDFYLNQSQKNVLADAIKEIKKLP